MSTTSQLRLFGNFELILNGDPAEKVQQSPQQQMLLAYLLLHRDQIVPRQQIAFAFWPDTSEKQARTNLRQLLHHLRKAIPDLDQFVEINNQSLRWRVNSPLKCDLHIFDTMLLTVKRLETTQDKIEALTGVVNQYRGDLCLDCYAEWILAHREALRQQYHTALTQLVELHTEAQQFEISIDYAKRLLQLDPLYESTYGTLIELYRLNGNRAAAMRVYHDCAALLRTELGVEPSAQTVAIYDRLLFDKETTSSELVSESILPDPLVREAESTDLIGRDVEFRQLQTAWDDASTGHAQAYVVSGEAGMGKTRLAEELLLRTGRQGVLSAHTRSYAAAGGLAYGPIADWLRSDALKPVWSNLPRTQLSEIARVVPELLVEQPSLPKPDPLTERWQRKQMFEALANAFCAYPKPLLLMIDDLQWCDSDTLEFLEFLLHVDPTKPLLILGTMRPEEVDPKDRLTSLLLNLRSEGLIGGIELTPLSEEETAALATQTANFELELNEQETIFSATAGNPLFVVETVRSQSYVTNDDESLATSLSVLPERHISIPPRIYATIQRRLLALSPVAKELASIAATIGRSFSFELLVGVSEYTEDAVVRGLDELWQRRLVRERHGMAYDFSHDRIRDVAYAEITPVGRRSLHGRVAERLKNYQRNDAGDNHLQIAQQFEQAGNLVQTLEAYQLAATQMRDLYSFQTAVSCLRKAIEILDQLPASKSTAAQKVSIHLELAEDLMMTDGHTAISKKEVLERACSIAQKLNDDRLQYEAINALRGYWGLSGERYKAKSMTEELIRLSDKIQDKTFHIRTVFSIANDDLHMGRFEAALERCKDAISLLEKIELGESPEYTIDPNFIGPKCRIMEALWACGYVDQACHAIQEVLDKFVTQQKHPWMIGFAYCFSVFTLHNMRDMDMLEQVAEGYFRAAEKYDMFNYKLDSALFLAWARAKKDLSSNGLGIIKDSIKAMRDHNDGFYHPYFTSILAEAQALYGYTEEAIETLEFCIQLSEEKGERFWDAELYRLGGEYRQRIGEHPNIVEHYFCKGIKIAKTQGAKPLQLRATTSLARLWQEQGKHEEAHQMLAEIYNWFTEGFDTQDLIEAKTLLDELA